MNDSKVIWTVFMIVNGIIFFWLWNKGIPAFVAAKDMTYLSFLIVILYVTSVASLIKDILSTTTPFKEKFETQYYVANQLTALGLLGTVIGLMYGTDSLATIELNIDAPETILGALTHLFTAISTALVTTIVGLMCSILLKTQIVVLNKVHKNEIK